MQPGRSAVLYAVAALVLLAGCPSSDAAAAAAVERRAGVTPVEKVIQLMKSMLAKGKEEKRQEQVQYATYKQFCDDTQTEKTSNIEDAAEKITVLEADIRKYEATSRKMARDLKNHGEDIEEWTEDKRVTKNERESERKSYEEQHSELSDTLEALKGALKMLKEGVDKVEEDAAAAQAASSASASASAASAASFAELSALQDLPLVPEDAKEAISAFLQQNPDMPAAKEPQAVKTHSDVIIEMLEKMVDSFLYKRNELEKKEMKDKHNFKLAQEELDAQIEQATTDTSTKTQAKAKAEENKASAHGDLKDTQADKKADETYFEELVATCDQKAADFKTRQKLRAEELEAIHKAIEIIAGGAVKGASESHLAFQQQTSSGAALAFLRARAEGSAENSMRAHVAQLLKSRAETTESRVLAALAERVAAGGDPFKKVKDMIQDLITKMLETAAEEAEHKGWCDTELGTNKQTRTSKSEAVDTLVAEIEQLEASNIKLTEDIKELSEGVAELEKAMEKATELRAKEKEKNEATIEDSQEAQAAVEQALVVLKNFYEKAGESTAFAQLGQQPEAPEIFDAPYTGMGAESGGVVGMLEVIESDFARLQADTTSAEATAQKEYDTFMSDSKVDKMSKTKDMEHKESKKGNQENALVAKQEDLAATQKELAAAQKYFEKLKPSCLEPDESYEEKVARRNEEIQSLKDCLDILSGDDFA